MTSVHKKFVLKCMAFRYGSRTVNACGVVNTQYTGRVACRVWEEGQWVKVTALRHGGALLAGVRHRQPEVSSNWLRRMTRTLLDSRCGHH